MDKILIERFIDKLNELHISIRWGEFAHFGRGDIHIFVNAKDGLNAHVAVTTYGVVPNWSKIEVYRGGVRVGLFNSLGQIVIKRIDQSPEQSDKLTFRLSER